MRGNVNTLPYPVPTVYTVPYPVPTVYTVPNPVPAVYTVPYPVRTHGSAGRYTDIDIDIAIFAKYRISNDIFYEYRVSRYFYGLTHREKYLKSQFIFSLILK